jgi:hypothetical protein
MNLFKRDCLVTLRSPRRRIRRVASQLMIERYNGDSRKADRRFRRFRRKRIRRIGPFDPLMILERGPARRKFAKHSADLPKFIGRVTQLGK